MPNLKTHCAISKKRTGRKFTKLHKWIDDSREELGSDHRILRHSYNEEDKNLIKRYWDARGEGLGEKAVIEWLFHIAIDNLDTAFKMSRKSYIYYEKAYNLMKFGLRKSGYIYCDFDTVDENDLVHMFEDNYEEE